MIPTSSADTDHDTAQVRWGFVGTGTIAGWMADVVQTVLVARLAAVASRHIESATSFAERHGAEKAFDSWQEMLAWEGLDAVYVATPTALREEICVAAANAGKHVLGEKPFASLPSLRRITAACRANDVGFMDATHFVHHPRYIAVRSAAEEAIGRPQTLDTAFLVSLADRSDIRYDPGLEPLGAIGDLGWYNLRATLEYLSSGAEPDKVSTRLHRDDESGALIAGEGSLTFGDGTVSRWRCGFDATMAPDIRLTLQGPKGAIRMDNFVGEDEDGSARYRVAGKTIRVESPASGPALMFEHFAAMAADSSLREPWLRSSEATQALLDMVLAAAEDPA